MRSSRLGWRLDAFDVMLYALVLASVMAEIGMDRATGGLLGSLTLAASAVGGSSASLPIVGAAPARRRSA